MHHHSHHHGRSAMIGSGAAVNFGNEFFNISCPIEIPIQGFGNGQHLRVVCVPTRGQENRFHVNLHSPQDILLHFNVRFDERAIVRNSTHGGAWQNEERHCHDHFPFEHDRVYTLEFISQHGHIHVKLNGRPFVDFAERVPGYDANLITIGGDVAVHSVHVSH